MLIDKVLGVFAPHHCRGCGQAGGGLCSDCFSVITDSPYSKCIICETLVTGNNLCATCRLKSPFLRVFVVGERAGTLKRLVDDFKFNSERGQVKVIIGLLDTVVPDLPSDTIVVPIPTIAPHIRQRGFGHTELIARLFARKRGLKYDGRLLTRITNSVQHGLTACERRKQAAETFAVNKRRVIPREILLIDDIYTTGATVIAAAKLLREAGVKTVNLAIIARQEKKS